MQIFVRSYSKVVLNHYSEVHSFIRDDLEFLDHLPTTVNPNCELVSFDVVNLYTNIPHDLGISAITFWMAIKWLNR
jgi:hypothetical protein